MVIDKCLFKYIVHFFNDLFFYVFGRERERERGVGGQREREKKEADSPWSVKPDAGLISQLT